MNYKLVSLDGGNNFDLNGVRFNGNSYLFWKKKSTKVVREVIVVFDKKYESMQVLDWVVVLSLKGINQYSALKEAIQTFRQIFGNMEMRFRFLVANENEKLLVDNLANELGISYVVQKMYQDVEIKQDDIVRNMEKEMVEHNLSAGGNQILSKNDNGTLKQITVHNDVLYENRGLLNTEEEKMILLREWMKDPVKAAELRNLSVEERNDLLMRSIMSNRKGYQMESASQVSANDKVGEVAREKASNEDGLVNSELGVVRNNVSSSNAYSAVERVGDNGVQVVNSNIMQSDVSVNGISGSNFGQRNQVMMENSNVSFEQEQQRNVDKVFYIDEEYNLYDDVGKLIGKVGVDGYMPDYSNNTLKKNGELVGYIGDYKNMSNKNNQEYSKPKTRVFKKETIYESEKSAAFISLPVVIFILSALLLVSSIILLFVVE